MNNKFSRLVHNPAIGAPEVAQYERLIWCKQHLI
jgi:hypothetical protein